MNGFLRLMNIVKKRIGFMCAFDHESVDFISEN